MVFTKAERIFYMEYELKYYYRVKYAPKVIGRTYFIILNKIDELDGTNERLLKYYKDNIEKHPKV